jgi:CRISPR-associated protein Cmr6
MADNIRNRPAHGQSGPRNDGPRGSGGGHGQVPPTSVLPLYREAGEARPRLAADSHGGLWFDRFFDAYHWTRDGRLDIHKDGRESLQGRWLEKLAGTGANPRRVGDGAHLAAYRARLERLAAALNGECRVFVSDWNFVTGMGLPHPLENGLAWHPTLGTPYLAGAGVKGLTRAFLKQWTDLDAALIERWFGPDLEDPKKEAAAGEFVFFDAVPVEPPALTVDVMTPHMGQWYAEGGGIEGHLPPEKVPADWHDPVPVKFLAVKEIKLVFAIAPRRRPGDAEGLATLFEGLEQALRLLGAGAKTAVGYGRFGRPKRG